MLKPTHYLGSFCRDEKQPTENTNMYYFSKDDIGIGQPI